MEDGLWYEVTDLEISDISNYGSPTIACTFKLIDESLSKKIFRDYHVDFELLDSKGNVLDKQGSGYQRLNGDRSVGSIESFETRLE